MLRILMILGITLLLICCGASKSVQEANPDLDQMIATKDLEFRAKFAHPMVTQSMSQVASSGMLPPGSNIGQIDVSSSANFLKIHGDSVSANLSYFGERQMGGGYNNKPGIVFQGIPKDMKIVKDEKSNAYDLRFSIGDKSETFQITTQINPNLSSTISVASSHRTRIRYTGTILNATDIKKE
ncbi:DUF4251 domain-containing protein [Maribacter sp. 2308TA10-17]|uniref:DUF4251 domain-containing protein n=1 Tax=Maribacter sp. 2308TA10-17 TaxID=3386276 RepID=UPI0039BD54D9